MQMKILLAVDGSAYTKRMLGYVAAHEELLGADHEYSIYTVVTPIPPHATHFLDRERLTDYYRETAEEVLQPIRAFAAQKGWKAEVDYGVGPAAEQIAAFAQTGRHDMVVMGTPGHSALGNLVLGSVASGVLARCTAPVLLIR
jgi:nucleotide-binding universal stress UspA family protein